MKPMLMKWIAACKQFCALLTFPVWLGASGLMLVLGLLDLLLRLLGLSKAVALYGAVILLLIALTWYVHKRIQ